MLRQDEHPTRKALVECTRELIDRKGVDAVTVDMVLTESGISKGSLYHHFKDFDALIHTVQVRNFSQFVDEGISFLEGAMGRANSAEELRSNLYSVIELAHDPQRASHRIERARIIGSSGSAIDFSEAVAQEQERLLRRSEDLIAQAQQRGWVTPVLSPRAVSMFIMSFTFGRVLDDVVKEHVQPDEWNAVVRQFVDRILLSVDN